MRFGHLARTLLAGAVLALLAGCTSPPRDAYVSAAGGTQVGLALGADSTGAACVDQIRPSGAEAFIYCGDVTQPSARIVTVDGGGSPSRLSVSSPWRVALNERLTCNAPVATSLFGQPAVTLQCTRRIGGWPRLGLVTVINGKTYFGDADPSALAPLQRGIAVASGEVSANSVKTLPISPGLAALREKNQAISSRDIRQYDDLMTAGVRANLTDNFAAAEGAFREAAALQKPGNPARADPLMHQALQLSNMGRYVDADAVFRRAAAALAKAGRDGRTLPDPVLAPELSLYRALDQLNQGHAENALPLLDKAERGYEAIIPPDQRSVQGPTAATRTGGLQAMVSALADEQLFQQPTVAAALLGLISTKRARAVAYLALHRLRDSAAQAKAAADLAAQNGLAEAVVKARIFRTNAVIDSARGEKDRSLTLLTRATTAFDQIFPDSLPVAETELLRAAALLRHGHIGEGKSACGRAVKLLRRLDSGGVSTALMMPCLDIFAASAAAAKGATNEDDYAQMFAAAQLAQSSVTSQQIAQAAARLAETQRNSKIGKAIRRREQTTALLNQLYRKRDELAARRQDGQRPSKEEVASLDSAIAKAEAAQADAESAMQAAAPNYGELVQQVVTAKQVFRLLGPHEALAVIVLGHSEGWTFLLRADSIIARRIDGGAGKIDALVKRFRASMVLGADNRPAPFDTGAAHGLYTAVLGPVAESLKGVTSLTVAPTGSLLSVPFAALLTGPVAPHGDLAHAPFLVREMAISHVPSAASFVNLRQSVKLARAPRPWFGLGDFRPPTLRQAMATFPAKACGESARELASLPTLPGAQKELEVARLLTGAGKSSELLGDKFTVQNVLRAPLNQYRILHFATHAVLPGELPCQPEPAVLTSVAPDAPNASGAMLTASQIQMMNLNADLVILAACNTGGANGSGAGESLSGLARAFFFAGARSLLVTHWDAWDDTTTYLTALFLQSLLAHPSDGPAAALAAAQRRMLNEAVGPKAVYGHPYYWAVEALIGGWGATGSAPATTAANTRTAAKRS